MCIGTKFQIYSIVQEMTEQLIQICLIFQDYTNEKSIYLDPMKRVNKILIYFNTCPMSDTYGYVYELHV